MRVHGVLGHLDAAEAEVGNHLIVIDGPVDQPRKLAGGGIVDVAIVVLVPVHVADIGNRQHGVPRNLVLDAEAVLITGRRFVVGLGKAGDTGHRDRRHLGRAGQQAEVRVG